MSEAPSWLEPAPGRPGEYRLSDAADRVIGDAFRMHYQATREIATLAEWGLWMEKVRAVFAVPKVEELLHRFVDHETDPCRLDHHGYCQEHPGCHEINDCPVAKGRALLGQSA